MSLEVAKEENRLGTQPINKLLLTTAIPLIISMLVQALYNMVDSLYVSQVSQDAFNAISLAYPVQNIMNAVASGTGTGVVTLISKSLGEKNQHKANRYAMTGVFLAFCSYVLTLIFGMTCVDIFFRSQTNIETIVSGGKDYLTICCCFSFGMFGQVILERLMQSTGKSALSMYTQAVGAVLNIVLDPIFIFGWFGIPAMGVAGAAVATVAGQIISMVVGLILNNKYNNEIKLKLAGFKPEIKTIGEIYKIGVPSIITLGIGSVMTYMMNKLLISIELTATAAAVFGAFFKIQSFVNMPVIGLSYGMMPIVGYNLGAKNKKRMMKTYHCSLVYSFAYMTLCACVMFFVPEVVLSIFNPSEYMVEIGVPAFRIISVSYFFVAFSLITTTFFMACGKSLLSLLMGFVRQLVVLVPVAYLIGYTVGFNYVWYAIPVGELGALAIAIFGRIRMQRSLLSKLPDIVE